MGIDKRDLVVTRVFDAPPDRVWKAWTDPDDVMQWWGPQGFTAPVANMDVREGGTSLVAMRSPEGQDMYNTWTYEAVVPKERLVFVSRFADGDGNAVDPTSMGLPPDMPGEVRHEVRFSDLGERTEVTVTEFDWPVGQLMEMSRIGQEQTLDKMALHLASEA